MKQSTYARLLREGQIFVDGSGWPYWTVQYVEAIPTEDGEPFLYRVYVRERSRYLTFSATDRVRLRMAKKAW